MYPELKGKVVVVTGAGGTIGRSVALAFAAAGARVAAADLNLDAAKETCSLAARQGNEVSAYKVDIGSAAELGSLVQQVVAAQGGVDIWVNNAGVPQAGRPSLVDMSEEMFDRIVRINLKGTWLGMKAVLPHMVGKGGGCIVNVCSVMGLVAAPGLSVYAASKHGVLGLTKGAALEYGPQGVRINAVCPSRMQDAMSGNTPAFEAERLAGMRMMNPASGRGSRADEVAAAIQFLCSDGAANIHGTALAVDGGFTAQ